MISPTVDSHFKHVLQHRPTLQVKVTAPKLKPMDDCMSHIRKSFKNVPENNAQTG
jgi:hypothetical protein